MYLFTKKVLAVSMFLFHLEFTVCPRLALNTLKILLALSSRALGLKMFISTPTQQISLESLCVVYVLGFGNSGKRSI